MLKSEMTTDVNFDAASPIATVFSYQKPIIHRLKQLCEQYPEEYHFIGENKAGGCEFQMPQSLIRFSRPVSEARREASRRNAAKNGFCGLKLRTKTAADETGKELHGDD